MDAFLISMISRSADNSETPRICSICAVETDSVLCEKDGIKTFSLSSPAGMLVKRLAEKNKLSGSELIHSSKFGYDLRLDTSKVVSQKRLVEDLSLYFEVLEEHIKPELVVFSKDHRKSGETIRRAFDIYAAGSGVEHTIVSGMLSTTMTPFVGASLAYWEKKLVMAVHATASHNPPQYNGVKVHAGNFDRNFMPRLNFDEILNGKKVIDAYAGWCSNFSSYDGDIVFDSMNGAGNLVIQKIAAKLYPRARFLNEKILSDFGGLKPEPGWKVDWKGFGVTFDGDADRSPFYIDSKMIFFSRLLSGMLSHGLIDEKKVLADQRTPPHVVDFMEEQGVKVIEGDIGNTNQSLLSKKEDALWYEENWHSGGYPIEGERFYWGEAPFAVAFWLDKLKMPVKQVLEGVPDFEYTEERFRLSPGFNEHILSVADDYAVLPSGGIRVENKGGHFLLRESNTEIGTVKLLASGIDGQALNKSLEAGRKLVSAVKRQGAD